MLDINWFMKRLWSLEYISKYIRKDLKIPVIDNDDALANGFLPKYDYPNLVDVFSDL